MTKDDILKKLGDIMARSAQEKVDGASITMTTSIASLGFDSLSILDLIYDLQQEFGVEFEAEELIAVKTVGALVEFLAKKGA